MNVNGDEFTERPPKVPETQPATSGGPPQPPPPPPKRTTKGMLEPGDPDRRILVADYIEMKELAALLGLKPFKVVADVLELGVFKHADEWIDFATAAEVAIRHGVLAERLAPE